MRLLLTPAVILMCLLSPLGAEVLAQTDPLMAWGPARCQGAVVFRQWDALADLTDLLERRFGRSRAVAKGVARLRALRAGPVALAARAWGPGLDLSQGVGIFVVDGPGNPISRIVVGIQPEQADQALATLVSRLAGMGAEVSVHPRGMMLGDQPMLCGGRGAFLVCDVKEVPRAPDGPPGWAIDAPVPTDGAGLIYLDMTGDGGPMGLRVVRRVFLSVAQVADRVEVAASVALDPLASGPLSLWLSPKSASPAFLEIDARTPGLLALRFEPQALLAGLEALSGGPVPRPVRGLWSALRRGWTGALALAFDGDLDHPVVVVGTKSPADGRRIVEQMAAALSTTGAQVSLARAEGWPGVEVMGIGRTGPLAQVQLGPPAADGDRLNLHFVQRPHALVFALAPADAARRLSPAHQPLPLQGPLLGQGGHGLVLHGWPLSLNWGLLSQLIESSDPQMAWVRTQGWLWTALTLLVDEVGVVVRPGPGRMEGRAWVRLL